MKKLLQQATMFVLCLLGSTTSWAYATLYNQGSGSMVFTYQRCFISWVVGEPMDCELEVHTGPVASMSLAHLDNIDDHHWLFVNSVTVTLPDNTSYTKNFKNAGRFSPCIVTGEGEGLLFQDFWQYKDVFCTRGSGFAK